MNTSDTERDLTSPSAPLATGDEVIAAIQPFPIDISQYHDPIPKSQKIRRLVWNIVWAVAFRPSFSRAFNWRRRILRLFGAQIAATSNIYPSAKIWAPWNLKMGAYATLAPGVDIYCMAPIEIEEHATISQRAFLCAGSHDISDPHMALIWAPVTVKRGAWVCAEAFLAPGVSIGEGAVVGARGCVFKSVEAWSVVGGNPAKFIKKREIRPSL